MEHHSSIGLDQFHLILQVIIRIKWTIIRLKRLENLLTKGIDAMIPLEWFDFPFEMIQETFGPVDINAEELKSTWENFQQLGYETFIQVAEHENELLNLMKQIQMYPSDPAAAEIVDDVIKSRENLEKALESGLENARNDKHAFCASIKDLFSQDALLLCFK